MEVDANFSPCPVDVDDEIYANGIFEFNITKMLQLIDNKPDLFPLEEVAVSGFYGEFSSVNESHLDSVEISTPVILAEISPGRFNLIDGHHRMEKARRMGAMFPTIPCRISLSIVLKLLKIISANNHVFIKESTIFPNFPPIRR